LFPNQSFLTVRHNEELELSNFLLLAELILPDPRSSISDHSPQKIIAESKDK